MISSLLSSTKNVQIERQRIIAAERVSNRLKTSQREQQQKQEKENLRKSQRFDAMDLEKMRELASERAIEVSSISLLI